jgi:fatty-acyl-CoA synthase
MMDVPLSIISLIQYAANYHGEVEIVSRTLENEIHRYSYRDAYIRIKKLANALKSLGIGPQDRIGTVAWNGYRHFELYYAIPGIGAVCHTVNPRLPEAQVGATIAHAEDKIIFAEPDFVSLLEEVAESTGCVGTYVIMTDEARMPETNLANVLCYETLIAGADEDFANQDYDWPSLDENSAAALCYSSGTTGRPKGVLYTHRSTILHSFAACMPDNFGIASRDCVLPVVPMFHVSGWCLPYICPMVGAKLVFPGSRMDGQAIFELLDGEGVTMTAGVPTVWIMLLEHLRASGKKVPRLKRLLIGGAAVPKSMIETFETEFGVEARQGWGMTEMSPVGTIGGLKGAQAELSRDKQYAYKATQGRPVFGVELEIVDKSGTPLPHDGKNFGEVRVRGPWVVGEYFKDAAANEAAFDAAGWFRTGDVSTIDSDGYMRIVDRTKDVIKSGGEWISSIDIENAAVGHPEIIEAAAIALPHPKWGERPLLIAVAAEGGAPTRDGVLAYLARHLSKLEMPDDVVFVEELPHTTTGKLRKTALREMFKEHVLPTA